MNCGLGPSLEPVSASREQNLSLTLYPNPLPWGYNGCFCWQILYVQALFY